MPLPEFDADGYLPPGLHAAPLAEINMRFGGVSEVRARQSQLLSQVVAAANAYPTIKRVLIWGSFVTAKLEPNDLDYSIVVAASHRRTQIAEAHRRFFVPAIARRHYGMDQGYLVIADYPLDTYIELLDFISHTRRRQPYGIVEISIRGEYAGGNS